MEKEILAKYLNVPIEDIKGEQHYYESDGAYYIIGDDEFWDKYINNYCVNLAEELVSSEVPDFYRTYIDIDKLSRDLSYDYASAVDLDFRIVEEVGEYTIATEW